MRAIPAGCGRGVEEAGEEALLSKNKRNKRCTVLTVVERERNRRRADSTINDSNSRQSWGFATAAHMKKRLIGDGGEVRLISRTLSELRLGFRAGEGADFSRDAKYATIDRLRLLR